MADKVSSYEAAEIKVLEGLEPVRKRPGMYIGSTDSKGLHHLAKEILDNAVDEALVGYGKVIQIFRDKPTEIEQQLAGKRALGAEAISVVDNGRGIPVGMHTSGVSALEVVLTKLHAGGKFEDSAYKASGGLHGVGSSAVNALSAVLQVLVKRNGKYHYQSYNRGNPEKTVAVISETEAKKLFPKEHGAFVGYQTGTILRFIPDPEIFSTTEFSYKTLIEAIKDRAYLMAGLYFQFRDFITNQEHDYYFENGIKSLVEHLNMNKKTLHPVMYCEDTWTDDTGKFQIAAEIALQYNDSYNERLESYVNVIHTADGGAHVNGFRMALSKVVRDYADKNNLIKDKESFTSEDLREGLTAVVFVKMSSNDLQFESQTKAKLNNTEAQSAVYKILRDKLTEYFEENPQAARNIIGKVLLSARARLAARAAKEAVIRKGLFEGSSLPGKLADCQSKVAAESEIYIVEGDSAGGTAKQGRDRKFQAIFPLRGKILNTERARLDKIVAFEELKNLVIALGAGIGDTFKPEKLRYHRIILMNDADVDGEHITTLGLTFFFRHLPEIVEGGYLYVAMPPLFRITAGKNDIYVYSDEEREKRVAEIEIETPSAKISIQRYKGLGEMNETQLWDTTMNPQTRMLKRITIEDADAADITFSTLMGDDVAPRKKFIQSHAQLAELDI
ncbi:MAG: DNA topoisomerase IV subunit B [Candidatus Pacebacteria bacterium CG10_big_fil_rev_8_21_14_0_10_44_54]|nr:MAG: DNA topoisomerase IV subunit B [Candidatus Pacebacteria bacterium CG10_big_fil_rev_8_21_14_0_10_44_54]